MSKIVKIVFAGAVLLVLAGCGGGSSTPPPPPPVVLTISPNSAILPINQQQQFNAFLSNSGTPAIQPSTWSVNSVPGGNSTVGTITTNGLYTAPAAFPSPNMIMISAVLISDSSKTANATVNVEFPNNNHLGQAIPVKLGTTGGNSTDISAGFCCSGTLGSLWTRADLANPIILSNNHVLDKSSFGAVNDPVGQPGLADNNCVPGTVVAHMTQAAALKPNPCTGVCTGAAPSNVDAAIAQIVPGTVDAAGNILDLGAAGTTSIAAAPPSTLAATTTVGGQVAKSGRTTGLTCSTLLAVSNVQVDYDTACNGTKAFTATFNNQTTVSGGNFSAGGDSGSLIVDATNARAVALLYAGNTSSTVGNPIANVITALSNGVNTLTIVGGGDHAVSCVPEATASSISRNNSAEDVSGLSPQQVQRATEAKRLFAAQSMRDSAINSLAAGKSADNPKESALIVHVNGPPFTSIPAQINGVRTRVVHDRGEEPQPQLATADFSRGMALKDNYSKTMLGKEGVYGVGIGMSDDNPPEPALVFFVDPAANHPPFPAIIEEMRTKIVEGEPFRAFGWNQRLEPKGRGCSKPVNSTVGKSLK